MTDSDDLRNRLRDLEERFTAGARPLVVFETDAGELVDYDGTPVVSAPSSVCFILPDELRQRWQRGGFGCDKADGDDPSGEHTGRDQGANNDD